MRSIHNRDYQTGKEGTILTAIPRYKTDRILRQKNLPDPFYLEGTQRITQMHNFINKCESRQTIPPVIILGDVK